MASSPVVEGEAWAPACMYADFDTLWLPNYIPIHLRYIRCLFKEGEDSPRANFIFHTHAILHDSTVEDTEPIQRCYETLIDHAERRFVEAANRMLKVKTKGKRMDKGICKKWAEEITVALSSLHLQA